MLIKFETKSNRVKGISFHPKRSWVLASLHTGVIQLWDYRMGTLIDKFEEHEGPVRGIQFHHTQPLFVSGGDDYKVKMWNYKARRCLFTLMGHLDYIRTVDFHHEYPWVVSASDDQTIRIWNWQSRSCLSVLTGHNHYVMSASFHPKEDLVVSASLDQTVRVWDISGLRKKTVSPTEDILRLPQQVNADLFGTGDAVVKYVLEGHDRGVNWAAFHPSLPLIVSGADDRQVKLWRMNDTKAWEVDSLRGHVNNVSCVMFFSKHDLIVSNSEDRSVRIWDMSNRSAIQTFRRENDRFWILASHPEVNLLAAGHDSGMIIFKLERERPAAVSYQGMLYYVRDRHLRTYDYNSRRDNPLVPIRRPGASSGEQRFKNPRSLSYNPAEQAVLVNTDVDGGTYELHYLPKDSAGRAESSDVRRGSGSCAVFVARNRFAVLDGAAGAISIKNMQNDVVKRTEVPCPSVDLIFYAGTGALMCRNEDKVVLFDLQQRAALGEIAAAGVKYVVWNEDMTRAALMGKHDIYLVSKRLQHFCTVHETMRVKSGAWDDAGVYVYSTHTHIKYALPNGDTGIIKTIEQPIYVTKVFGNTIFCLDREAKPKAIEVDTTEYMFKLSLLQRKFDQVLQMVRSTSLCGNSIISYLQEKGHSEIALHFVKDDATRFNLALDCGNIEVALEAAQSLEDDGTWHKLGLEALRQGNHQIVEFAYQKTKNFGRLSFLYLISGNLTKLSKMLKIAEINGDMMGRFQNALYLGDVRERLKILESSGQLPLAYVTAGTHGLEDEAQRLRLELENNGYEIPELPKDAKLLVPPHPLRQEGNWPLLTPARSERPRMEAAPSGIADTLGGEMDVEEDIGTGWNEEAMDLSAELGVKGEEEVYEDVREDEEEGWAMEDIELPAPAASGAAAARTDDVEKSFTVPTEGVSWSRQWPRESSLAPEHAAAGAFESACRMLQRQIGAANFEPLKQGMLTIAQSCYASFPGLPSASDISLPVPRANNPKSPAVPFSLKQCEEQLQRAYKLTTDGKFGEAYKMFLNILHTLPLIVVDNKKEVDDAKELVSIAKEYIVGLRMETRRKEEKDNQERNAELAAYFTHCHMQPIHSSLALRSAMFIFYKMGNLDTAAGFCRRLLDLNPPQKLAQQARQVLQACEQSPADQVKINYDPRNPFVPCPATYQPLYRGQSDVSCPYCSAKHAPEMANSICCVCQIARLGASATGLVVCNAQLR